MKSASPLRVILTFVAIQIEISIATESNFDIRCNQNEIFVKITLSGGADFILDCNEYSLNYLKETLFVCDKRMLIKETLFVYIGF